jgi:glycosyltransferase involved in cell wall biosynthesis
MKTVHVAMIIHSYHPIVGGAERQLQAVLPLLKARGVQATVLTRRYSGLSAFEMVDGTPVFRLPAIGPKPLAALTFISSALLRLLSIRPNIIHAYDLMSPTTTALLTRFFLRTPVIAKVLSGGPKGDIDRIRHGLHGETRLRSLARQVDKFIVISQEIASELDEIGASKNQYAFIPNGVDLGKYFPVASSQKMEIRRTLNLPVSSLIALFVGRIIPEKRPEHLLAIWNAVREKFPTALLVMVGDGSELERLRVMQVEGVHFTDKLDGVQAYMQAADIFVLPSAREGLSNALLEAQASGLPVITTAIGAAPELIQDGANGLLINVDDVPALQAAVLRLLGDADLRIKFFAAGHRSVSQYSLENTADRLADLYRELIGGRIN